jgi:hypothetical protein
MPRAGSEPSPRERGPRRRRRFRDGGWAPSVEGVAASAAISRDYVARWLRWRTPATSSSRMTVPPKNSGYLTA